MRKITFTAYPNCYANEGAVLTEFWDSWAKILTQHAVRGTPADTNNKHALDANKNGMCIVLGEIPKGKTRSKKNVTRMHALGVDIEGIAEDHVEEVIKKLQGWEFILYTTHKHGSEVAKGFPRYRLIMPLAKPVPAKDWPVIWSRLNMLVDGINDPSTKDASRLNYMPSTFDASVAEAHRFEGVWISVNDLPNHIQDASTATEISDSAARTVASKIKARLKRVANDHHLKKSATQIIAGEPFAESGERHETIRELTWMLAEKDKNYPAEALFIVFGPSINAMQQEDPSTPGLDDVERTYTGAVERMRSDKTKKQRSFQLEHADGKGEYSEEELEEIAAVLKCEVHELRNKWIVQKDTTFYFLMADGKYSPPATLAEARVEAVAHLNRAPVMLNEISKNGTPRRRTITELTEDYGQKTHKIIADLKVQESYYLHRSRTMHEAACPLRDLEPEDDPHVSEWLEILAGKHHEKLLDWLACLPKLDRLLCAIYLGGHPGGGKTLLAQACARLWTTGSATEIEKALDDFNEEYTKCPLVLGDEAVPKFWKGNPTTTKLRSMLSVTSRTLSRKHKAPADLVGCIRLILTANSDHLLSGDGASNHMDLQAIAQRFLYIEVPEAATKYLEALPEDIRDGFLEGDGIAKHILYLSKTRKVKRGKRFWVEGDTNAMHRMLMTGTAWNSLVCEWLARYLMNPTTFDAAGTGLIRRNDKGRLLVNAQAIIDGWKMYLETHKDPETAKIGTALRAISTKAKPFQARFKGKQIRYRVIDVEYLFDWANRYDISNKEVLAFSLQGGNPARMSSEEPDDLGSIPAVNEQPI